MSTDAPPELVRELAAVPRARFVAERTAHAKALRAEGRRSEAAAVAKLRKPSLVTWAVNAAAREAPDAAGALVTAVRRMQQPGDIDVRTTAREVDARLDELVDAAAGELGRCGERVDSERRASVRAALRATALAGDAHAFLEARLPDADDTGGDSTLEAALLAGAHGRADRRRQGGTRRTSRGPDAGGDDADEGDATEADAAAARAERQRLQAALRDARSAHAAADDEVRAARRTLRAAERAAEEAAASVTELQARLADLPEAST